MQGRSVIFHGQHNAEPAGEIRYQGLDVSACTGAIDFAAVRESGRAAVYIRASVADDYIDPALDANYIAARENGLLTGFYHVLTARAPEQARAQARFFAAAVAGREMQLRRRWTLTTLPA